MYIELHLCQDQPSLLLEEASLPGALLVNSAAFSIHFGILSACTRCPAFLLPPNKQDKDSVPHDKYPFLPIS